MPGIDLRVYNQVQSPNKACQSKSKPDHTHHPLELIYGFAQKIDPYRNSPRMTEAVAWIWGIGQNHNMVLRKRHGSGWKLNSYSGELMLTHVSAR